MNLQLSSLYKVMLLKASSLLETGKEKLFLSAYPFNFTDAIAYEIVQKDPNMVNLWKQAKQWNV